MTSVSTDTHHHAYGFAEPGSLSLSPSYSYLGSFLANSTLQFLLVNLTIRNAFQGKGNENLKKLQQDYL